MNIRDQRQRTLKDLTVRRVLKDGKVPRTRDPRRVKGGRSPSPGARAAAAVLGEGQAELRAARCFFGPGGLE